MIARRYKLLRQPVLAASCTVASISSSASLQQNVMDHYEILGIQRSSTQSDIKAAYYKLSMLYHPDKNKGSEDAAQKFREITQAYEVLSNYKLRKLYDKGGIIIGRGAKPHTTYTDDLAPNIHDDNDTKFYKSRFRKNKVVDMSGRTPIYDFDEWSKAHYGKTFERRKDSHERYQRKTAANKDADKFLQNEILLFALCFGLVITYAMFMAESALDTPKQPPTDKSKDK